MSKDLSEETKTHLNLIYQTCVAHRNHYTSLSPEEVTPDDESLNILGSAFVLLYRNYVMSSESKEAEKKRRETLN